MDIPYAEVIGDPIAHSKSPLIHRFWLQRNGIEAEYRSRRVTLSELETYFSDRLADPLWRGCNVTMPLKTAALSQATYADLRAEQIGATNCVRRTGWATLALNTDVDGVYRAFFAGGLVPGRTAACLVGAGGAARAALWELSDIDVRRVNIISRNQAQATRLLADFGQAGDAFAFEEADQAVRGCTCLINASPLGMVGAAQMPVSVLSALPALCERAFVFDMVYKPVQTELLKTAADLGLRAIDGLEMLIGQAHTSFQHLFDVGAALRDDPELRELLTR